MKIPKTHLSVLAIIFIMMCFIACKKDKSARCTDPNAINYNSKTESCFYAYSKYVGSYTAEESFQSQNCGDGDITYPVTIAGAGSAGLVVKGLHGGLDGIVYNLYGSTMTGGELTLLDAYAYDSVKFAPTGYWDFRPSAMHGIIEDQDLYINYYLIDTLYGNTCGQVYAQVHLSPN